MSEDLQIGRVLEGKYELVRVLGTGGMGAVYEANHSLIKRKLAIKLLHKECARDQETVTRFQQEARIAAAIGHDHIVDITDMGTTDTGELFIAMEFLDGGDLSDVIKKQGSLPPRRACHIAIQVLSALEAAHEKGIIHRDLKPANVFLIEKSGSMDYVKLVDFGISKMHEQGGELAGGLTRAGELLGTPLYMSPEQAKGELHITPATDTYAVGVMLYEMLTGSLPFKAKTLTMLLDKIISAPPEDPRAILSDLNPELVAIIMKALSKNPADRYVNAADFRRDLRPFSPETAMLTGLKTTSFSQNIPLDLISDNRGSIGSSKEMSAIDTRTPLSMIETVTPSVERKSKAIPIAITVALMIVLILGGAIGFLLKDKQSSQNTKASVETPVKTVEALVAKPVIETKPKPVEPVVSLDLPKASTQFSFTLRVIPGNAAITIDDVPMGDGSFKKKMPIDNADHEIVVSHPGYRDHRQKVLFDEDKSLEIKLDRLPRTSASSPSAKDEPRPTPKEKPAVRPIDEEFPLD